MARHQVPTHRQRLKAETEAGHIHETVRELGAEYPRWIDGETAETTGGGRAFYLRKMAYRWNVRLFQADLTYVVATYTALSGGSYPDVNDSRQGRGNDQATLSAFCRYHDHRGIDPKNELERNRGRELPPSDRLTHNDGENRLLPALSTLGADRVSLLAWRQGNALTQFAPLP